MSLDDALREQLSDLIAAHPVTLFMKGTRQQPQCGFSNTVVRILDTLVPDYQTVDVLSNPDIREGIKLFSSWPTIPQLYVRGEFVGGCDIVQEMFESGELATALGVSLPDGAAPAIEISDEAAEQLRAAVAQQSGPGRGLHLAVDARFQANLFIGPVGGNEVAVESNGVRLLLDPVSAARADGIRMDVVSTPQGPGFKIHNPNAPQVKPMSVKELAALLDAGERFELLDVRTEEERERARIPGATLMTDAQAERLEALPKSTKIVFHCHHGGRSQRAAEHFAALGFTDVHNVEGGIDAWSREVDPSVPRY
ncbi:MAG: Grx4 family monothiol glutaredoxin [Myxococcota bacterium]